MCVCVCVWFGSSCSFKHVPLNDKDKFCLYNLFNILLSFQQSLLVSGWKSPKKLGTIVGNSSTNSNQKLRHLSENVKGS